MKKVFLIFLLISMNLFALSSVSSLPENNKKLINNIIADLGISKNTKTDIESEINKEIENFLEKGWSVHWNVNDTLSKSKLVHANVKHVDLMIYNNNRVTNVLFLYFEDEKQLLITTKQYVEGKSDTVLKIYNEYKTKKDYSVENEEDNYAYFKEKGYASYVTFHISKPAGMIVYEKSYIIDIK